MTHGHSRPLTGRSTMPQVRNGVEVTRKMLAERDEVKAYIGQDVILVAQGAMNQLTVVVGNLYDYGFFDDIPFGTAKMLGAAKFRVVVTADEYQVGKGSWTFPTRAALQEWASGTVPARLEFIESSLPAGAQMETIRNVFAVVPLQPGVKDIYFEKANEFVEINYKDTH